MMISSMKNQKKQVNCSKRTSPKRVFGSSYWYISNGLMKVSKEYYRPIDKYRYENFNYYYSEDDCIQEIERNGSKILERI